MLKDVFKIGKLAKSQGNDGIQFTLFHILFCFYFFLRLRLWHMEVPRLGVESENILMVAY